MENLWGSITNRFSDFVIITIGTFIVHESIWLILNAFYITLDQKKLFSKFKLQQESYPSQQKEMGAFYRLLRGHVFQLLPITLLAYPLLRYFGLHSSKQIPSAREMTIQLIVFNVVEDFGFYWIHRLLHVPYLYNRVHYLHHEYTAPFSLVGEIAHPIEFLFNFLLPLMAGPFLMGKLQGVHVLTYWIWLVFREIRSADAHSGYHLPFHPIRLLDPIYGGPREHDFHHRVEGRLSNFGGYKFWDWIMGTNVKYHEWCKKTASNVLQRERTTM